MIAWLSRRALAALFILWAVSSVTFVATLKLGDPVTIIAGPRASARDRAHVRQFYGLDQSAWVQYTRYLRNVVRGDLGTSFRYRRPVAQLIGERFPRTLLLALMAMAFELTIGLTLGILAAAQRGTRTDSAVMTTSFVLMSTPTFVSGRMLLMGLAYYSGLFPIGGYGVDLLDHVYHGVLPALALAMLSTAFYARLLRNEMVDVLQADYVRTARAKGVGEATVVLRHGFRNALLPVVTSIGLSFGSMFTGAIVTEAIFAWPGLGRLAYESITGLDVPVIVGTVIFGSFGILLGNLLTDLAYAALDPRIRTA